MFSKDTISLIESLNKQTSPLLEKNVHEYVNTLNKPLSIIYNLIHSKYSKLSEQFHSKDISISVKKVTQPKDKLTSILFLSQKDLKQIIKLPLSYQYTATFKTNTIQLTISSIKKVSTKFIYRLFSKCFMLLTLFRPHIHDKIYNLYLWLSDLKKIQPTYKKEYNGEHINSGATVHNILKDNSENNIQENAPVELYIWRKEEFEKVLIHELIHTLKLDFMSYPEELTEVIHSYFNIPYDISIHVGEAYVETWATILNSILISKNINIFFEIFEKEVLFSLFQFSKVILHFEYDCFRKCKQSLLTSLHGNNDNVSQFKQDTSVFSYYILKTGMLMHIDDFLKYCITYNDNLLEFNQSYFKEFQDILLLITKNTKGVHIIEDALENYKEYLNKKKNYKTKLHKTMRMTLHELK